MVDLSTTYLGLELENPIVVASCKLTSTVDGVKTCEDAGAGAVVLKSLFEEQIISDSRTMIDGLNYATHTDAYDYFVKSSENYYLDNYLELLEKAQKSVSVPVIPSINCITAGNWIEYAERFESIGAKALELNVFVIPADVDKSGRAIESVYFEILKRIKQHISLPVAMKLGPHFSGLANLLKEFARQGLDGTVLFNRFYRPDIDIHNLKIIPASILSVPEEMSLPLQWIALLSGEIEMDFAAATGIHSAEAAIKQILAGAKVIQLCSTLYKNDLSRIKTIKQGFQEWMESKEFSRLAEFQGMLCQEKSENPEFYERSQYIKALVGIS